MYGRRKRTESHEKSMGSYELFAWRDAMSIASLLDELFDLPFARVKFESLASTDIVEFEKNNLQLIGDFIQKSESQRLPFLNKITKDSNEQSRIIFLVLAIIGVLRAMRVMELRDSFRTVLAPGRGNRVTTAAVYDFSNDIRDVYTYDWPDELFDAIGLSSNGDFEDDDQD